MLNAKALQLVTTAIKKNHNQILSKKESHFLTVYNKGNRRVFSAEP